jgi:hypothetical protein
VPLCEYRDPFGPELRYAVHYPNGKKMISGFFANGRKWRKPEYLRTPTDKRGIATGGKSGLLMARFGQLFYKRGGTGMKLRKISEQVMVITGASSGIGLTGRVDNCSSRRHLDQILM